MDGRQYPWGNDVVDRQRANYCDTGCDQAEVDQEPQAGKVYTMRVGSYPLGKSPYGIDDLAGNVWEWVHDWYDDAYYHNSPDRNPENATPKVYRVARGGGWSTNPTRLRVTFRRRLTPGFRHGAVGFRCIQRVEELRQ
jgi:formylglycine-generating enzyme required for sulfatase activity